MFEHLDNLTMSSASLLADLRPLDEHEVERLREEFPCCPEDYFVFLIERGAGELEDGDMFFFERHLVDAVGELFRDQEICKLGAKGPVKIFGSEWSGINYGFDAGDNWSLVQVDTDRTVKKLKLTFKEFVEGMFVCYPDFPVSYNAGKWRVATGEEYSVQ